MRPLRATSAFSFIEMLVVLVIGSVLYVAALGPMRSYLDGKRSTLCAENLRKLHLVMSLYAAEHDEAFPAVQAKAEADEAFALLVPKYTSDPGVFACPVSRKPIGYSYVSGLKRTDTAPLVLDTEAGHGKLPGNILFADGHLEKFEAGARRLPSLPARAKVLEPFQ